MYRPVVWQMVRSSEQKLCTIRHAQVKAQEEQRCRDEPVRLALSMQPALGSNTSEAEQIGMDADNIPPAPEQIAAEAGGNVGRKLRQKQSGARKARAK